MTTPGPEERSPAIPEPARALLRHALATLAYRGGKAVRDRLGPGQASPHPEFE